MKLKLIILIILSLKLLRSSAQPLQKGQQIPQTTFSQTFNYHKPTLDLNQYKNKMIVFDFWSLNCIGCIQSFPKLDSLQKKFGNDIQLILVNREPLAKVKEFFEKRKKIKIPQVPFICNDTILQQLFPHIGVPAYAWLNKEHQFLFVTNGSDLNEQSITKLMNNQSLKLAAHQTGRQPVKNVINKEYEEKLQFVSYLTSCISGNQESFSDELQKRSTVIQVKCAAATDLYLTAFNEEGKYNYKRVGRLITDFEEPFKYSKPANEALIQEWKKQYAYHYELLVPRSDTLLKFIYMKQDLQRFFQLSAEIKSVYKNCIVLEQTGSTEMLKSKGSNAANSFFRSSVSGDITTTERALQNLPFSYLVHNLAAWLEAEYKLPFENAVSFEENIDIRLSAEAVESLNIKKLNGELKQYGLVLVEKEMPVRCLVLSDKTKPVQ